LVINHPSARDGARKGKKRKKGGGQLKNRAGRESYAQHRWNYRQPKKMEKKKGNKDKERGTVMTSSKKKGKRDPRKK